MGMPHAGHRMRPTARSRRNPQSANPQLKLSDFDFHLPEHLIAQEPPAERGTSRLLVVDRRAGMWSDRYIADLPSLLTAGDLLVVNKIEASALVPTIAGKIGEGGPPLGPDSEEPPSSLARQGLTGGGYHLGLRSFFTALRDAGARYVLVTDGAAGSFLADKDLIRFCPAAATTVAGTAGAGDAYAATLATYLAQGRAPEDAMRAAALNAAAVVGYIDTQSGLLTGADLAEALEDAGAGLTISQWRI